MDEYRFPFEKLEVWQLSKELAGVVLDYMEGFPPNKHFRLIGQMEAAAASPAQNIAEGKGRQHKKEFIQFLYIARGSLFEVVTLNHLFRERELFTEAQSLEVRRRCEEIDKKLLGLIKTLRK